MANLPTWGNMASDLASNNAINDEDDNDLFNVKSMVSTSTNIQPDDVVKTKKALNSLGEYGPPKFGITEIPDQKMINGLKNVQSKNGLKVDGVMKPKGPTEKAIGQNLAAQGINQTALLNTAKPKEQKMNKSIQKQADRDKLAQQKQHELEEKAKQTVMQKLQGLMQDERYPKNEAYLQHVQGQFEKAYPGNVEYDDTGKMIQPKAAIRPDEVEEFDKSELTQDDSKKEVSQESEGTPCGQALAEIENALKAKSKYCK